MYIYIFMCVCVPIMVGFIFSIHIFAVTPLGFSCISPLRWRESRQTMHLQEDLIDLSADAGR